jgi:hypothetical protein
MEIKEYRFEGLAWNQVTSNRSIQPLSSKSSSNFQRKTGLKNVTPTYFETSQYILDRRAQPREGVAGLQLHPKSKLEKNRQILQTRLYQAFTWIGPQLKLAADIGW